MKIPRPVTPVKRNASDAAKGGVDWAAVRAKLERSAAAAEARETPADAAALLARRAEMLARPEVDAAAGMETTEVVAFELNGQAFALAAEQVKETVILRDLTRLPGLPETVRGVVNIRSRIVAAVDLRPLLQLGPATTAGEEKLLIVSADGAEFGIVADQVLGLRSLRRVLRREVPGLNDKYLRGLGEDGLIVLSLPALVEDLAVEERPET